jgi:hypothetical protein
LILCRDDRNFFGVAEYSWGLFIPACAVGYEELSVMRDRFHWIRLLAFVTGLVNQELLLRNEYLVAENRILRARLSSRLRLTVPERSTLADPAELAGLGDRRLHASQQELTDALSGHLTEAQRLVLKLYLEPIDILERHMADLAVCGKTASF